MNAVICWVFSPKDSLLFNWFLKVGTRTKAESESADFSTLVSATASFVLTQKQNQKVVHEVAQQSQVKGGTLPLCSGVGVFHYLCWGKEWQHFPPSHGKLPPTLVSVEVQLEPFSEVRATYVLGREATESAWGLCVMVLCTVTSGHHWGWKSSVLMRLVKKPQQIGKCAMVQINLPTDKWWMDSGLTYLKMNKCNASY